MPVRGVIQSPVLVGRDAFLTLMENRLADAAAGTGRVLFVAGEAGIGKTRLLGSLTRRAQSSSFARERAIRRQPGPGPAANGPAGAGNPRASGSGRACGAVAAIAAAPRSRRT